MTQNQNTNPLSDAIVKLSQYEEWGEIAKYIESQREYAIQALCGRTRTGEFMTDATERIDAKLIGSVAAYDDVLQLFRNG